VLILLELQGAMFAFVEVRILKELRSETSVERSTEVMR